MSPQWIADGCAEATRLREAGYSDRAADVLAFAEKMAFLGVECVRCRAPYCRHHASQRYCSKACQYAGEKERAAERLLCSRQDCLNRVKRGEPICPEHLPRFDSRPRHRASVDELLQAAYAGWSSASTAADAGVDRCRADHGRWVGER